MKTRVIVNFNYVAYAAVGDLRENGSQLDQIQSYEIRYPYRAGRKSNIMSLIR